MAADRHSLAGGQLLYEGVSVGREQHPVDGRRSVSDQVCLPGLVHPVHEGESRHSPESMAEMGSVLVSTPS